MQRLLAGLIGLLLAACATQAEPTAAPSSVAPSTTPRVSATATAQPTPTATPLPTHRIAGARNEELREELLAMMAADQEVRTAEMPEDPAEQSELFVEWDRVDRENGQRMQEILDEFGWPGWSLVGEDGAFAAWALIQHQDLNLELQKRGLVMMTAAVDADDADPSDLAYLIDRVLVAEGKNQIYGTQVGEGPDGEIAPRTPIDDPENVDARRAAVGLGTLEEYYEEFRRMFEATPSPSPSG